MYLFTSALNNKLPVYYSLVLDPIAWKQDVLQHPLTLIRVMTVSRLSVSLRALLRSHKEWFPDLELLVEEPPRFKTIRNLLVQPREEILAENI